MYATDGQTDGRTDREKQRLLLLPYVGWGITTVYSFFPQDNPGGWLLEFFCSHLSQYDCSLACSSHANERENLLQCALPIMESELIMLIVGPALFSSV